LRIESIYAKQAIPLRGGIFDPPSKLKNLRKVEETEKKAQGENGER
jgi:hypothetical protein